MSQTSASFADANGVRRGPERVPLVDDQVGGVAFELVTERCLFVFWILGDGDLLEGFWENSPVSTNPGLPHPEGLRRASRL